MLNSLHGCRPFAKRTFDLAKRPKSPLSRQGSGSSEPGYELASQPQCSPFILSDVFSHQLVDSLTISCGFYWLLFYVCFACILACVYVCVSKFLVIFSFRFTLWNSL